MKKIISSVLSTAMLLSCVTTIVSADEPVAASSTVYTIDASAKKVSKVAPLTTVAKFKSNITDDEKIEVINVDGTVMPDNAYATENVFAKIDGSLYKISVEYPYDPINTYGRNNRKDGDVLFQIESANFNSTVDNQPVLTNSGFAYAISGYKLGDASGAAPALNAGARTLITKQTEDGEPVYVIQNNAPRYAFLRSHYSGASYESQTQSALTDITKGKVSVTTVTFKSDKMGNVSLHHNAAGYATSFKGDAALERFTYSGNATYIPNAIHFTEDGTIKIGGTYTNIGISAADRTPKHTTAATWEANKEYTVSVVQKLNEGGGRYGYVYGVYVNGEKIFPKGNEAKDSNSHFSYSSSKDAYSMTTRSGDHKYLGGISSVLVGAAPKTAGEDIKVSFSDVKVYTIDAASLYTGDIDSELALENAEEVEIDGTVINVYTEETVESLRAKYPEYAIAVYNADGTQPAATDNLATGMSAKVVSDNGLQVKLYSISATKKINDTVPESEVYTVDTENKTISKVKPLTKVSDFLANFANGSLMKVVNIDGSVMADDAYATENVTLVAPNGDNYSIVVSYPYSPIQTNGNYLDDGRELYNIAAVNADNRSMTNTGFEKTQVYDKIGYGSDKASPANTETQTVKATKQTVNGETVYVMENDSNKYAYIRSDSTDSPNYSTPFNNLISSWTTTPIVTTVEFEADKLGNISVFNNTPVRDGSGNMKKGDSGVDGLIYSSEIPYAPNSVHFLDDGSVKLGGIYANYSASLRNPIQETDFTWEPGKKYTVSIVQRYLRGKREGYVDGVYVNGTKIFPNSKTVSYDGGRVALLSDGTFKIGTRDSSYTHGGGLSSIMIGTAPKAANENLTVTLSDVKVYNVAAYNAAMDKDIILTSNTSKVVIDNDNALISCMGSFDASSIATDAKVKVDGNSLKAVSADGLVSKTYTIVSEEVRTSFLNGENGPEITSLVNAGNSVCFKAEVDATSLLDGTNAAVVIAVYDKTTKLLKDCVIAEGVKNADEVTTYKAVIDISAYNKNDIEICGFAWDGFKNMEPLSAKAELK